MQTIMISDRRQVSTDYDRRSAVLRTLTLEDVLEIVTWRSHSSSSQVTRPIEARARSRRTALSSTSPDMIDAKGPRRWRMLPFEARQPPIAARQAAAIGAGEIGYPLVVRRRTCSAGARWSRRPPRSRRTCAKRSRYRTIRRCSSTFLSDAIEVGVGICDGENVVIGGIWEHLDRRVAVNARVLAAAYSLPGHGLPPADRGDGAGFPSSG
jgi:hypothetical protein